MKPLRQVLTFFAALVSTVVSAACDSACPVGTHQVGGICRINMEPQSEAGQNPNGSQGPENASTTRGAQQGVSGASGSTAVSMSKGAGGTVVSTNGVGGANGNATINLTAGAGAASSMLTAGVGMAGAGQSVPGGMSGSSGASTTQNGSKMTSEPTCMPTGPEDCDGKDNDCDSAVDESIVPRECGGPTIGIGECVAGKEECVAGAWSGSCVGEVKPTKELCDAAMKDEDCDGKIDNDCPCTTGQTRKCSTPPSCKEGMQTCENGVWGTQCAGEVRGSAEKCDGEDNDCNGKIDDQAKCPTAGAYCHEGRCVMCADDSECSSLTRDCKVGTCSANGTCTAKSASDSTTCSNGQGVCKGGSCVDCIGSQDCRSHSGAPVCQGNKCVACTATEGCLAGETCTSRGCIKKCGNGTVESDEECDPGAGSGWTIQSCTEQCKRRIWASCTDNGQCPSGLNCADSSLNVCTKFFCTGNESCPAFPGYATECTSNSMCEMACNAGDACPHGMHCITSGTKLNSMTPFKSCAQ